MGNETLIAMGLDEHGREKPPYLLLPDHASLNAFTLYRPATMGRGFDQCSLCGHELGIKIGLIFPADATYPDWWAGAFLYWGDQQHSLSVLARSVESMARLVAEYDQLRLFRFDEADAAARKARHENAAPA